MSWNQRGGAVMQTMLVLLGIVALGAGAAAGERAFRAGDYAAAVAEYQRALERGDESPEIPYNLGTSLLLLGRYEEAREQLTVASRARTARVRQPAEYNLGNTDLEPAFRGPHDAERAAVLRRAVEAYQRALLLDPDDQDAKWNLELALRLLAQQGGGGAADDPPRGGGGGADGPPSPATPEPSPGPAAGAGTDPRMEQTQAERVLRQAAAVERTLQQEKLRRTQPPPPNVRDW